MRNQLLIRFVKTPIVIVAGLFGPIIGTTNIADASTPASADSATTSPIVGPLQWKSSAILIEPKSDETHQLVSIKDPTIVYYDDRWHVYATSANAQGNWNMVYLSFQDWTDAMSAQPYYIDNNPNLTRYHCAPFVCYFRPHKKWYLIYQSQHPQYSTTDDISKPETWTKPESFFASKPESAPQLWIDYWLICDDTHAYLFFTGDNGRFYRCRTTIQDFPHGMSDPEIAIEETRETVFEGSMTYKIKGTSKYLTLIEGLSPSRFYKAYLAGRLDGEWTPITGADTFEQPFAGANNVTFAEGVSPWTYEISHAEMIRDGYDQTPTIDPRNMQMLYQGRHPGSDGKRYHALPYRLGLLRLDTSNKLAQESPAIETR
jgi:hypothetical protein